MSSSQRYRRGDWVRVAEDLGPYRRHFTGGCEAIVVGSYADQFGGSRRERNSYTVFIKGEGRVSWYDEDDFTLIEPNRIDKLEAWEREAEEVSRQVSDIDWIFANGKSVLEGAHGVTVQVLANHLGKGDLWGPRGEGIDWYINARATLRVAKPFLESGDKDGWLAFCENFREAAR